MSIQTPELLAGSGSFVLDNVAYDLYGSLKWNPSQIDKTPIVGMGGKFGFKGAPVMPTASCVIMDDGQLTVGDFDAINNSTVVFHLANGKTISLSNAFTTGTREVDSVEGTLEISFSCYKITENLG